MRRLSRSLWWLVLLLLQPAFCVAQASSSVVDAHVNNENSPLPPHLPPTYKIGHGDVLQISVWDTPQFTTKAVVRPDGKISLPLIPDIPVFGMTPEAAQNVLTVQLAKFVRDPRVSVIVEEIHSRIAYITGEVERPGAYPLTDSITVVQLIARSGGLTDFAKKKQIYVLRGATNERVDIDYQKIMKGRAPGENISLEPGDTVVVP